MPTGAGKPLQTLRWARPYVLTAIAVFGTIGIGCAASGIPLPRPRPAMPGPAPAGTPAAPPSDPGCMERLASIAVIQPFPDIKGPGACEANNVVHLSSVRTAEAGHIKVSPPASLRCGTAERFAQWVQQAFEAIKKDSGDLITQIRIATSFDCRGQNGNSDAKLSQHGLANAVDVQSFGFRNGRNLSLTDPLAPVRLRAWLHDSACKSFTTVLGPGSDGYHEDHIHLDLAERRSGYRICQWDVREANSSRSETEPSQRP
jgi:hypothetical protein